MTEMERAREVAHRVLNYKSELFKVQKYLLEQYGVETHIDDEGTLYLWSSIMNESLGQQKLEQAKEYVNRTINRGMIAKVLIEEPEL